MEILVWRVLDKRNRLSILIGSKKVWSISKLSTYIRNFFIAPLCNEYVGRKCTIVIQPIYDNLNTIDENNCCILKMYIPINPIRAGGGHI